MRDPDEIQEECLRKTLKQFTPMRKFVLEYERHIALEESKILLDAAKVKKWIRPITL